MARRTRRKPDDVTMHHNRAHVAIRDIERVEWTPSPAPRKEYVSPANDAEFNRRFAAYRGSVSREDCEFLWRIGVRAFPEKSKEYLAVASFAVINRELSPTMVDAVIRRLLDAFFASTRTQHLSNLRQQIYHNPRHRNLIPYLPESFLKNKENNLFSEPVSLPS